MITQQMSFPILGIKAASCADIIETSLSRVEGVIDARVNYASERARLVFVPARSLAANLLNAVRSDGCDIPLVRRQVTLGELARTPIRLDALVDVRLDWRRARVVIECLSCESSTLAPASVRTALSLLARLVRHSGQPVVRPVRRVPSPEVTPRPT